MGRLRNHSRRRGRCYGHQKKVNVGDLFSEEVKRIAKEETIVSDLTYDLRSGDPDFTDKLVATTFGNLAMDAVQEGKSGLMTGITNGCFELVADPGSRAWGPAKSISPMPTTPTATARATTACAVCPSSSLAPDGHS